MAVPSHLRHQQQLLLQILLVLSLKELAEALGGFPPYQLVGPTQHTSQAPFCCRSRSVAFHVYPSTSVAAVCSRSTSSNCGHNWRRISNCREHPWLRKCSAPCRILSRNSNSTAVNGIPHFYRWLCNQFPTCVQPLQRYVWRGLARQSDSSSTSSSKTSSSTSSSRAAKDIVRERMLQQLQREEELLLQQFQSTFGAASAAAGADFSLLQCNLDEQQQQQIPIDALLIDFNALLHLCIHGHIPDSPAVSLLQQQQQLLQPLLQQQHLPLLLQRVLSYLDLLVKLVRPRTLLCVTLDGVPPAAKLAQQRSRRFRQQREQQQRQQQLQQRSLFQDDTTVPTTALLSASIAGTSPDATAAAAAAAGIATAAASAATTAPAGEDNRFDTNSIGPGTHFMFVAESTLRRFIAYKQRSSKVWGAMRAIVFSGADVPGEGEHKLMQLLTRGSWASPNAALAEAWSSEVQQHQQQRKTLQHRRKKQPAARFRVLLPPSFEELTAATSLHVTRAAASSAAGVAFPVAADSPTDKVAPPGETASDKPSMQQQQPQQQQDLSELLVALPGRICLYGLDADLLVLALARQRPGLLILREKQRSLRGTRAAAARQVLLRIQDALRSQQEQQQGQKEQQERQRQQDAQPHAQSEPGNGEGKGRQQDQQGEPQQQQEGQQPASNGFLLPATGDFLRYTAKDFEVVCIDSLRHQLVRSLATAAANEAGIAAAIAAAAAEPQRQATGASIQSTATAASRVGLRKKPPEAIRGVRRVGLAAPSCQIPLGSLRGIPRGSFLGASLRQLQELEASRLVDDFVLLSFFVGNDFLPALPHINIYAGGFSWLLQLYTRALPVLGGPLTRKTQIHLPRLIRFFALISHQEGPHFEPGGPPGPLRKERAAEYYAAKFPLQDLAAAEGRGSFLPSGDAGSHEEGSLGGSPSSATRLPGVPFGVFRHELCVKYISGLFFLLHYYHSGTPSWSWEFPYNYAPLASDLGALRAPKLRITLPHAQPISPYQQLLAVLPPSSTRLLPAPYRRLHVAPNHTAIETMFPSSFLVDPCPLQAIPYPGKASELSEGASIPTSDDTEASAATAAVAAAMDEGKQALERALKRVPTKDKSAQLPEWLHRPIIPFLDLKWLRSAAAEAVEASLENGAKWSPEDYFRNRLGRPHIFVSPRQSRSAEKPNKRQSTKTRTKRPI
ncbi:XRN 5'-3' exonuclease N-terminus domain-containing protein, putative [Eimeria necatrix]|uniref:XRN 5'-3' exonuclease N-terminus domain-containing protein, putative n=1 Tax=Eimeria necatrix TaxID=51315 RepID=U6MT36_9EIME|nr:XRN 5'-3' exonuclease N-terminus domain-containing protein, putative [Eimeria necatrix]CDJ67176.1 XRN 5'-3' exonuclease N-terminus domain-containing protein, putative [Eimeria necatrix]